MKQKQIFLIIFFTLLSVSYAYAGAVNETNSLYDLTNISQAPDLYSFVKYANDLTGQVLMTGILLIGFVIFFISMKSYGNKEAMVSAGFLTAAIGVLFSAMDFISPKILGMIVICFTIMFSMLFFRRE